MVSVQESSQSIGGDGEVEWTDSARKRREHVEKGSPKVIGVFEAAHENAQRHR
jgi:hypothetical protein